MSIGPSDLTPALLQLPKTVGLADAQRVLAELSQTLQGVPAAAAVRLDASALHEFDSAVLAVLLALLRQAKTQGVDLQLVDVPPKLAELARVYGLSELLWPDLPAAA